MSLVFLVGLGVGVVVKIVVVVTVVVAVARLVLLVLECTDVMWCGTANKWSHFDFDVVGIMVLSSSVMTKYKTPALSP